MLVESGAGTEADIARASEESHGLGLFIRSLVGLDREAATAAFDRYLSDVHRSRRTSSASSSSSSSTSPPTASMEVARLYESPFTDHAPQGPDMIFTDDQVDGIVTILDQIRSRALLDVTVA